MWQSDACSSFSFGVLLEHVSKADGDDGLEAGKQRRKSACSQGDSGLASCHGVISDDLQHGLMKGVGRVGLVSLSASLRPAVQNAHGQGCWGISVKIQLALPTNMGLLFTKVYFFESVVSIGLVQKSLRVFVRERPFFYGSCSDVWPTQ